MVPGSTMSPGTQNFLIPPPNILCILLMPSLMSQGSCNSSKHHTLTKPHTETKSKGHEFLLKILLSLEVGKHFLEDSKKTSLISHQSEQDHVIAQVTVGSKSKIPAFSVTPQRWAPQQERWEGKEWAINSPCRIVLRQKYDERVNHFHCTRVRVCSYK